MTSPHRVVNPSGLAAPRGYAHAVVAAPGRTVHLAGQVAGDEQGVIRGDSLAAQFDAAAGNVVTALSAAGGAPEHIVSMTVYVTDVAAYREARPALRDVWRAHFGEHYPAMAVIGIASLVDPAALVEIVATAVLP